MWWNGNKCNVFYNKLFLRVILELLPEFSHIMEFHYKFYGKFHQNYCQKLFLISSFRNFGRKQIISFTIISTRRLLKIHPKTREIHWIPLERTPVIFRYFHVYLINQFFWRLFKFLKKKLCCNLGCTSLVPLSSKTCLDGYKNKTLFHQLSFQQQVIPKPLQNFISRKSWTNARKKARKMREFHTAVLELSFQKLNL